MTFWNILHFKSFSFLIIYKTNKIYSLQMCVSAGTKPQSLIQCQFDGWDGSWKLWLPQYIRLGGGGGGWREAECDRQVRT